MDILIKQNLEHIFQLVYDNFNIPLFILDKNSNRVCTIGKPSKSPLFDSVEHFINRLIKPNDQRNVPVIHITNYLETFILIHLSSNEVVIIGPFTNFQMTENSVNGLMRD